MSFTVVPCLPRKEPTGFSTHCRCCHTTLRAFPLFSSILPTLADRLGEDWASRTSRLERLRNAAQASDYRTWDHASVTGRSWGARAAEELGSPDRWTWVR